MTEPSHLPSSHYLSELKEIRDRVESLIKTLDEKDYEDTIQKNLHHSDLEIFVPYLIKFFRLDQNSLSKIRDGVHCPKTDWLYQNRITPLININPTQNLLVCPIPIDLINGVHSDYFPAQCLDDLFVHLAKTPHILSFFQEKINEAVKSIALRRKYKLSSNSMKNFDVDNHLQLKKDLITAHYVKHNSYTTVAPKINS